MSLWLPHSAFWDWQVNFGLPSLKYVCTLHAKFGASKPVIIIDSCVVRSWFTFANLQSVSQTARAKQIVFYIVFRTIHICTLKQHSMSTCRLNKHSETPSGSWQCYLKVCYWGGLGGLYWIWLIYMSVCIVTYIGIMKVSFCCLD